MNIIHPDWPAPDNIFAYSTTRKGGVSNAPYDALNLGLHVEDDTQSVLKNRQLLHETLSLPREPVWLDQVHSNVCCNVANLDADELVKADASFSVEANKVCLVMTADCLPVLFCDEQGTTVAAAHAGWRGLCDGVLEQTISAMRVKSSRIMAWLGPAIGPDAFEVGDEVRVAFVGKSSDSESAFVPSSHKGKWFADIYALARIRLLNAGVEQIFGGDFCTYSDQERFFSYRRDGRTGRMGSLIWFT